MQITLQTLASMELHILTCARAGREKVATLELLEALYWVEKRSVHLERGYSTLFEYATKALGYSEGQASDRIRAMRLAYRVEEVKRGLEDGSLSLSVVARLESHSKNEGLTPQEVRELLPQIEGTSVRQVEKLLASQTPEVKARERLIPVSATQSELRVTLTQETAELLREAQDLDENPGASLEGILKKALEQYVAKRKARKFGQLQTHNSTPASERPSLDCAHIPPPARTLHACMSSRGVELRVCSCNLGEERPKADLNEHAFRTSEIRKASSPHSRTIPRATRRAVTVRDQVKCTYQDPKTGKKCGSTRSLTYEHQVPFSLGGPTTEKNLTLYCSAHQAHSTQKINAQR